MHANLQPIEPGEAQQWYLEDRADSLGENTLKAHGYRTKRFVRWCGIEGIDDMNVLTGRHFARDKTWRQEDGDLNNVSLHTQLREHVTLELLWHCGFRTGDLIALDIEDFHPENHYVEVNHRPDTGTPLKNGDEGERWVKLRAGVVELLDDYLSINRVETVGEFGRSR